MHYYRKVIKIAGDDSPNVRLAKAEIKAGKPVSNTVLIPGVLTYAEYLHRLATWDDIRIHVGVKAEFYEGPELLLYPGSWLDRAHDIARSITPGMFRNGVRQARAMGVDPGEGGDPTVWTVGDEKGLIFLHSQRTPDTSIIPGMTIGFMKQYGIKPEKVMFDRGGGGYEHACQLNAMGHKGVQSVGFGEKVEVELKRSMTLLEERKEVRAEKYVYVNRRAEMYGTLRILLDPANEGYGIPAEYKELRRQLEPLPLWYDEEGRLYLPPKQRRAHERDKGNDDKITINKLIGCSPDEADSLVLMIYGMTKKSIIPRAGAA